MRAAVLALAFLLAALPLAGPAAAEDFGAYGKVNELIDVLASPQLAPGESGVFLFELNSTYTELLYDAALTIEIYGYATIEESIPVDSTWPYAYPRIRESGERNRTWSFATFEPGRMEPLQFTVDTVPDAKDMPHGSIFAQASYFLRMRFEFDGNVSGSLRHIVLASRGYFTAAQWSAATNETNTDPCTPPWCRGKLNLTYLTIAGVPIDGLLPDSSFGVKEPIPQWPFYLLVAAAAGFLVLSFLFWVEENPGTYPRVDAWWARTRGRLVQVRKGLRLAGRRSS